MRVKDAWDDRLSLLWLTPIRGLRDAAPGDRRCTTLLRDVEVLATLARGRACAYPHAALEKLWKLLLLNQFHDVLPVRRPFREAGSPWFAAPHSRTWPRPRGRQGSCIQDAFDDAQRYYATIAAEGGALRAAALGAWAGGPPTTDPGTLV